DLTEVTDAELVAMAESALGRRPEALLARIRAAQKPSGRTGPNVNSTTWGILALRQAGEKALPKAVRYLVRAQRGSGGWGWAPRGPTGPNQPRRSGRGASEPRPPWSTDPPRARVPRPPPEQGRRLRAHARTRLRHPVDRMGDPGVPGRTQAGPEGSLRLSP